MWEKGLLGSFVPGTFETLSKIHKYLFDEIYYFAGEIRELLKTALTSRTDDRDVYMKGIDASYNYEGYFTYRMNDLK